MLISDKLGRRRIVLVSVIVSTVSMLVIGILGFVPKTDPLKDLLIFVACLWDFFNIARKSSFKFAAPQEEKLIAALVGGLGWSFVGEVSNQKLRARTAGISAAISVIFGLIFNTSVPIMCKLSLRFPLPSNIPSAEYYGTRT